MSPSMTSLSQFLTAEAARPGGADTALVTLIDQVVQACLVIGATVSRGALVRHPEVATQVNIQGEAQKPLDVLANDTILRYCGAGGKLGGMVSEELDEPHIISPHGPYLLVFDPLDGSSNIDVNMTIGTIFSVLRAPPHSPTAADFLRPGREQVAAGMVLYGPQIMLILTLGAGTHGFTYDRGAGQFLMTHPAMQVPETTQEFAVNASNERFWEPPVRRYVRECLDGRNGPRGADFNMRWIASMVAEVHRVLIRGGLYMYPRDLKEPRRAGRLRLLYEANPAAMLIEQAGGAASTGRESILDQVPTDIHQRVPVILGSRREVERLARYHAAHDSGEEPIPRMPLFNVRSLFDGEMPRRSPCP